jgi:GR25 family glycosyltransferase involved in LPS biosynthesis
MFNINNINKKTLIISILLILLVIYLLYFKNKGENFTILKSDSFNINNCLDTITCTYVINLKKDVERKEFIKNHFKEHDISFNIFEGVNGLELDLEKLKTEKTLKDKERPLTKGEIGCYLSHVEIWKKFLSSDKKYCLIFEDDVKLCDDFKNKINTTLTELDKNNSNTDNDIIDAIYLNGEMSCKLFFGDYECNKNVIQNNMTNIKKPFRLGYGMYGYIISREGAKKILNYGIPMTMPIDVLMHYLNQISLMNITKTIDPYVIHIGLYSNTQKLEENTIKSEDNIKTEE